MKSNLTHNNTGFIAGWWHQKPGLPTVYYTRKAVRDAERLAAKRGNVLTDEPIGRNTTTTLTVVRAGERRCPCGNVFAVRIVDGQTSRCPDCRPKKRGVA